MSKKLQWKACPNCGSFQFTENSYEFCTQDHVRIDKKGKKNYDEAMNVELTGLESKDVTYTCMDCKKEFRLQEGKFVEVIT